MYTTRKMKFSIRDVFSKRHQIRRKVRISSDLLKKSLMENFISCGMVIPILQVKSEERINVE